MSGLGVVDILDVSDEASFRLLPPCADPRFDHRSCDYWEDEVDGSKEARPSWWRPPPPARPAPAPARPDNPFAPPPRQSAENPFAPRGARPSSLASPFADPDDDLGVVPAVNPFAPSDPAPAGPDPHAPRKLRLLQRGLRVFGSYAKVLRVEGEPVAYTQFGPLSAFPRAQSLRDLYPQLPAAPLPAVITCIATAAHARGRGLGTRLVEAVCRDLAERGFSAVEAYPDLRLSADATSSATPRFWLGCGFTLAVDDERFPVMRRDLA